MYHSKGRRGVNVNYINSGGKRHEESFDIKINFQQLLNRSVELNNSIEDNSNFNSYASLIDLESSDIKQKEVVVLSKKNYWKWIVASGTAVFVLLIGFFAISPTFARYSTEVAEDTSVSIADWVFDVNGYASGTYHIDLADTIVENDFTGDVVIPGSEGVISLGVNYKEIDVAFSYDIILDFSNFTLPSNLKLYKDSAYTLEISKSSGSEVLFSETVGLVNNGVTNYKIYWKWAYNEDDENEDANVDLGLNFVVQAVQLVGGGNS